MIQLAGIELEPIISFLNSRQLTAKPCKLIYLPQYDVIPYEHENGTKEVGYALYIRGMNEIYVAGMPNIEFENEEERKREIFKCIAHEYIHHIQYCEDREANEEEAEIRAEELWEEYKK